MDNFNNIKKEIDNIVWIIPIRKLRYSLRNYLTKLIEDNNLIKLQNNFILKKIYNNINDDKIINYNEEKSDFILNYNKINNNYKKQCVFYLGSNAGFYSELNNMVLGILYCLVNKIQFKLYSKTANFSSSGLGWEEFFIPFCNQTDEDMHSLFNGRSINKSLEEYNYLKKLYNIDYMVYDIWGNIRSKNFKKSFFYIEELGIKGNLRESVGLILKNIYRFNYNTKKEINTLIKSVNLPNKYIAAHIRSGDKIIECNLINYRQYMEIIQKYTDIKDLFIFTDDYTIIENIKKYYNEYNIFTLTNKNEKGYVLDELNSKSNKEKHNELIKLFAMVEISYKSELCFGSYTTNPSMFISAMMEKDRFIEVDSLDFDIY
ncbi:hypothetical protein [Brachyspira hyodysenteriae]|uniref:hypothetical protein n=1 Tax=Brachyspira hyodysenteriae TaxID=159 RepID=UPI00063DC1E6|nr:hypothetical protein [Brachyspira hyodysenteriae]KLI53440.1 hypothetical protein SZ42_01600 [Brachyspira hyodysenteriae]